MPIELPGRPDNPDQLKCSTNGPIVANLHPMSKPLTFGCSKFAELICLWLVASSALGCGGEVDTGQTVGAGASNSNPTTNSNAGAGGSQSNNGDQTLLPDCKPGFTVSQATPNQPCQFFVDTTCYSTQTEACACVCPRNQGPVLCIANANAYLAGTDAFGVWCVPKT